MRTQPLLNALRLAFLCGSIVAIATPLAWDRVRTYLDGLHGTLVEHHMKGPADALASAQSSFEAGQDEAGLTELADLARSLRHVRLGMRLAPVRTAALDALSARHLERGEDAAAMGWTEELLAFNPRDFPALVRRAELHRRAGHEAEALADARAAFSVGAATGAGIEPYLAALTRLERGEDLADAVLQLGERGPLAIPTTGWEFRSASGPAPDYDVHTPLKLETGLRSGAYLAVVEIPSGAATIEWLRVDLPPGARLRVQDLAFELFLVDGSVERFTHEHLTNAENIRVEADGVWIAEGTEDPYLMFRREGQAAVTGVRSVKVQMKLRPELPEAMLRLFPDGLPTEARPRWEQLHGADLVDSLEAALVR